LPPDAIKSAYACACPLVKVLDFISTIVEPLIASGKALLPLGEVIALLYLFKGLD